MSTPATLAVSNLRTRFGGSSAGATVVDGVTFTLQPGRTTALVGESGCGKSVTALSLMRLIEPPGHIVSGSVTLDGRDLLTLDEREMEQVRGARIGMVFQDPLTSLNPALSIGGQIVETLQAHQPMSRAQAERKAIELLARVGVANPEQRIHDLPASFQRRHASARAHRRSDQLFTERHHRRRADDGARRDCAGQDLAASARPAARHGRCAPVDHP